MLCCCLLSSFDDWEVLMVCLHTHYGYFHYSSDFSRVIAWVEGKWCLMFHWFLKLYPHDAAQIYARNFLCSPWRSVAALLGILVLRYFEKQGVPASLDNNEFVRVYSYGTPSCVDAKLADDPRTMSLVTSGKRPRYVVSLSKTKTLSSLMYTYLRRSSYSFLI